MRDTANERRVLESLATRLIHSVFESVFCPKNASSEAFSNTTVAGTKNKLYAPPIQTGNRRAQMGVLIASSTKYTTTVATAMVMISVTPHENRNAGAPASPRLAESAEAAHCGLKMYEAILFSRKQCYSKCG